MKLNKATHKNYFLIILMMAILLVVAFYKFKIVYTLDLISETRAAEERAITSINSAEKLAVLKSNLMSFEDRVDDKRNKEELQQDLLDFFTRIGQRSKLEVTGISEASVSILENYQITSFSIELSGVYSEIVRGLNDFEKNMNGMRLASVKFQSFDNRQLKQKQLKAFLYVQHLRLKKV